MNPRSIHLHRAKVVIDGHGSWNPGPLGANREARIRRRGADLFGFKASFSNAALPAGLLPVLAFSGGYGGLVVAEDGRVTVAGCIRRDTLQAVREKLRQESAGRAFEDYLRISCPAVQDSLKGAQRLGPWLSVGPLRLGIRINEHSGLFRVGNAAAETHPLVGEGMSMALESAFLLASQLTAHSAREIDAHCWTRIHRAYEPALRTAFAPRMRVAAAYAQVAMQRALRFPTQALLRRWPRMLTRAAQWAGKARRH